MIPGLQETEARYRAIFESTSEGIGIVDQDHIIVDANPAFAWMFGVTPQEMIGQRLELGEPEVLEGVESRGFYQRRVVNPRKDGSLAYQDARVSHVLYRDRPHFLVLMRNISEQVEAYELLERRVEARTRELSLLLDVAHNVASTLDLKSVLELILDALKEVIDYDGAAILSLDGDEITYLVRRAPTPAEPGDRYYFRPGKFDLIVYNPGPVATPDWGNGTSNTAHLLVNYKY